MGVKSNPCSWVGVKGIEVCCFLEERTVEIFLEVMQLYSSESIIHLSLRSFSFNTEEDIIKKRNSPDDLYSFILYKF